MNPSESILPGIDLSVAIEYVTQYFVASLRIGAFMISAPFFGTRYVMPQIRIMLAMVLTVIIATKTPLPDSATIGSAFGIALMLTEIAIGLSAGLITTIWFAAAALAGEKIASTAGLGYAAQMDPDAGGQTPVVSQILTLFLIVTFLALDGHLILFSLIMRSYEFSPIVVIPDLRVFIEGGIKAAGWMFLAASLIMLPIVTLLLMINISIGVITRSAPQLNLFSFGFPISMLGVFFILFISAPVLGYAFSDLVNATIEDVEFILGGLSGG